jgi:hypothetical protein
VLPKNEIELVMSINEYPGTIQSIQFVTRPMRSLSFSIEGERDTMIPLLLFFVDMVGRLKKFWMPDLFSYFTPLAIITDSKHRLRIAKIPNLYLHGKELLYLELADGSRVTRNIIEVIQGTNYTDLIFNTQVPEVEMPEISLCTLAYLGRLTQDTLDIEYTTDRLANTNLVFKELYEEYGD